MSPPFEPSCGRTAAASRRRPRRARRGSATKLSADQDYSSSTIMVRGSPRDGDRPFVNADARPQCSGRGACALRRRDAARDAGRRRPRRAARRLAARPRRPEERPADEPRRRVRASPGARRPVARRDRRTRAERSTIAASACAAAGSPSARVFLDNRQMDGKVGLLRRHAAGAGRPAAAVVLVQRGWAARHFTARTDAAGADDAGVPASRSRRRPPAPARLFEFAGAVERADPAESRPRFVRARHRPRPAAALGAAAGRSGLADGRRACCATGQRRPPTCR